MSYVNMKSGNGQPVSKLAVASLVVSIIGLLLQPFILGIVAIILGGIALGSAGKSGRGMAKAGIIIGAIGVIFTIAVYVTTFMTFYGLSHAYNTYNSFLLISTLFTIFA